MLDFLALRQQGRRLYRALLAPLQQHSGLTQIEVDALLYLANHPQQNTAAELVALRGLSKSQVSAAVKDLEGQGYLAGASGAEDRRAVRLSLLPKAAAVVQEGQACQAEFLRLLTAGFTPQEERMAEELFRRMAENAQRACLEKNKGETHV